jgi:pimeloyl-ACP methyl ester carboxylesterase
MNSSAIADWRAAGTYFEHRGHRIFWREGGLPDAPVLLLIHGFPTASWDWEAVWPELAMRYRLLTLDMIGFGFSDKPLDYDYSILDQADLCEALLRERGVGDYHVLAHDYGNDRNCRACVFSMAVCSLRRIARFSSRSCCCPPSAHWSRS